MLLVPLQMLGSWLRSRKRESLSAIDHPTRHHLLCDIGVKLDTVDIVAVAERLIVVSVAVG